MERQQYKTKPSNCPQCGSLFFVRFDTSTSTSKGEMRCPLCNYQIISWSEGEHFHSIEKKYPHRSEQEYDEFLNNLPVCKKCGGMLVEKLGRNGIYWICKKCK